MVQTDYGIAIGDYDAAPDAAADGENAADARPVEEASDTSIPMADAIYGGPHLDSGDAADEPD